MTSQQNEPERASVIPVLVYEDIAAAHDYLIRTFGFASAALYRGEDGHVIHAEVRMGQAAVWLHAVAEEHQMVSPRAQDRAHGGVEVIVGDVDAHYARSKAAGASVTYPPADKAHGLREYEARDPENHRWWFAAPLGG